MLLAEEQLGVYIELLHIISMYLYSGTSHSGLHLSDKHGPFNCVHFLKFNMGIGYIDVLLSSNTLH